MLKRILTLFALLLLPAYLAASPAFNYEGRLKSGGSNYNGTATFYFSLLTKNGGETFLWVNDGGSLSTIPSATGVSLTVTEGVFAVVIGDTTIANMTALPDTLAGISAPVFLRVWVDAGSGVEELNPDQRVLKSALIDLESSGALTIYVNDATGDDRHSGLLASRPKKTIQAAIDSLPRVLTGPTVVQVADGTYKEELLLSKIVLSGPNAAFALRGNTATPGAVIVDGEGTRANGLKIDGIQQNILIEGFRFDHYTANGITLYRASANLSDIEVNDCASNNIHGTASIFKLIDVTVTNANNGVVARDYSRVDLTTTTIDTASNIGLYLIASNGTLFSATIKNASVCGIRYQDNSTGFITVGPNVIDNCGSGGGSSGGALVVDSNSFARVAAITLKNSPRGCLAYRAGYAFFNAAGTVVQNNSVAGLVADRFGVIDYGTAFVSFSGNTLNTQQLSNGTVLAY